MRIRHLSLIYVWWWNYINQFYIIHYEMFDVQYILLQIKYLEGVIRTSEATIADLEAESVRVTKVRRVPTGGTTLSLNI